MKGSVPWIRHLPPANQIVCFLWIFSLIQQSYQKDLSPRIVLSPVDQYVAKNDPATLRCKADGSPRPQITWFKDGVKVTTSKDDPNSHRFLIDDGEQLFFLRIIHTKQQKPDLGTYYCVATNVHGRAVSSNATLQLAVLRDEFRESPVPVTAAAGETAHFRCRPPRGEPEPRVAWNKDGERLIPSARVTTADTGELTITGVKVKDAGNYTCLAINAGGEKESRPAQLKVLLKPTFLVLPDDVNVKEKQTVEMRCQASGDPTPSIQWKRKEGRISYGRARQLSDGTLRIEKVQSKDDDTYICVAENSAGAVEAEGRLTVQTDPKFVVKPSNLTVGVGRSATFQCVVVGNPKPAVYWTKGSDNKLMFPGQDIVPGYRVGLDGSLRISTVAFSDADVFYCQSLNGIADGGIKATAVLTVIPRDARPPPTVMTGPRNQTLSVAGTAVMRCEVKGPPPPHVTWYKDGEFLVADSARIEVMADGQNLRITDLRLTDAGRYTCRAISETGETDWDAWLKVIDDPKLVTSHHPPPLPSPPTKPRVSDVTDTSVHVTWSVSGQSGDVSFRVEFFSPDDASQGWQTAVTSVGHDEFTVKNLQPASDYLFQVRSLNDAGLSPPSPYSRMVTTRELRKNFAVNMPRDEIIKELAQIDIELRKVEVINATSLKVKWQVGQSLAAIEGYTINYTLLAGRDRGPVQSVLVRNPYQFWGEVRGLHAGSQYQVCVAAFTRDLTSQCSNTRVRRTEDGVPSGPPRHIVMRQDEENNGVHIRWEAPERHERNGEITEYDVDCVEKLTSRNCSMTSSGATDVFIPHTSPGGGAYTVRVAARTSKGRGVWSNQILIGPDQTDLTSEPWFLWLVVGVVGATVWLALCAVSVWLYRRRRRNKKKMSQNGMYSAVPVNKSEEAAPSGNAVNCDDVLYHQKEANTQAYSGLQSDLASLLECGHGYNATNCNIQCNTGNPGSPLPGTPLSGTPGTPMSGNPLKNFYQRQCSMASSIEPYATTAIVNKGQPRPSQGSSSGEGFRPINMAYVPSSNSGSGDSCHKPDLRRSGSNSDNSRQKTASGRRLDHCDCEGLVSPGSDSGSATTDDNGMPVKRNKYSKINIGSCRSCGQPKPPSHANYSDLLPPPPEMNSPDADTLHCRTMNSDPSNNLAETRFMVTSPPSSKSSSCSCPHAMVPNIRATSNINTSSYTDNCSPASYNCANCGRCSGSNSGSSNYNSLSDAASPKPPGRFHHGQHHADVNLQQRCQSPVTSCHNCGGCTSQQSNTNIPEHQHLHHHNLSNMNSFSQRQGGCLSPDLSVNGGLYSPISNGEYQDMAGSFSQQGGGASPFSPSPHPQGGPPAALHGYRMSPIDSSARNSSDFEHIHQGQGFLRNVQGGGANVDRACQSSLPSLASEALHGMRPPSPTCDQPDYLESDLDVHRTTDGQTSDSDVTGEVSADDADFASAVARAAELSGLTVVGTTVSDPKQVNGKKSRKHRVPAMRPSSPYSTDSNMSAVVHKPYPKSERKKQLLEQARKYGQKSVPVQEIEMAETDPNSVK